jgi:PKHD-type hydroxylase
MDNNNQKPETITPAMGSPIICVENAFPAPFLLECLKYADHLDPQEGRTGYLKREKDEEGNEVLSHGVDNPNIRQNVVKWIEPTTERGRAIWQQVDSTINNSAREYFGYDTWVGGTEGIQYTEYNYDENSEIKDHYDWHIDSSLMSPYPFDRKISFSLQLTAENEYTDCDLQFGIDVNADNEVFRRRGTLILFPSFLTHRVTPITGGTRKCLVGWCRGPKFR